MITCILGRAGSGKSYEAARLARKAAEDGRYVMTNLPLVMDRWKEYGERILYRDDISEDDAWLSKAEDWDELLEQRYLVGEGDAQKGPLVIIDEVVRVFSPRRLRGTSKDLGVQKQHSTLIQTSVENFIATHRHARIDIVFLGQTAKQLPDFLKHQVHEWVELKNHSSSGIPGYSFATFETWYGFREPIARGFRKYDKSVFDLYRSHAMAGSDIGEGRDKAHGYAIRKWYWRWQLWLLVGALVALVAWGIPSTIDVVSRLTGEGPARDVAGDGQLEDSIGVVVPVVSSETAAVLSADRIDAPIIDGVGVDGLWEGRQPDGWPSSGAGWLGRVGPWWIWADGRMGHVADLILAGCRPDLVRSVGAVIACRGGRVLWGGIANGVHDDGGKVEGAGLPAVAGGAVGGVSVSGSSG